MAKKVEATLIGVDVSKAELVLCQSGSKETLRVGNDRASIKRYLRGVPTGSCLGVEATNVYHLELVDQAHARGLEVYVISGFQLKHYRESIGGRAKTDASDAALMLRYLTHERACLRPWTPPPRGYRTLQCLLHRRAVLVQARTRLRQSLAGLPGMKPTVKALLKRFDMLDAMLRKRIKEQLRVSGWGEDARRCQAIEGIGPITAAMLATLWHRGDFGSSDAWIAFLGMDVRVRDSGTFRGRRKLTKKGDAEVRRLLYMAAMAARRSARWKPYYDRAVARGLTSIQALVALGRKLARIAFALMKNQTEYNPNSAGKACAAT